MSWIEELQRRTFDFAVLVVKFCRTLPANIESETFRRQLVRSGTSVGANYRATCRGRSRAEKRAKIGIAIEESDETLYWLELLTKLDMGDAETRQRLLQEADQITRILVSCRRGM